MLLNINFFLPSEIARRKTRANRIFILVTHTVTASTLFCLTVAYHWTTKQQFFRSSRNAETSPCARTSLHSWVFCWAGGGGGGGECNGENNKYQGWEKEKTPSSTVIDFGAGILIRIASHRFLDRGTVSPIFRRYTLLGDL